MTDTPPIGTNGVVSTDGHFVSRAIRWATGTEDQYSKWHDAQVNHAVTLVGPVNGFAKPQLMEADPSHGYHLSDWDKYPNMIWLTRIGQRQLDGSLIELHPTDDEREDIVHSAFYLGGRKYNLLDILAIATVQRRVRQYDKCDVDYQDDINRELVHPDFWVKRVSSIREVICSQAADYNWGQVLCPESGKRGLFADNRIPGLVSPADLLSLQIV